MASAEPEELQPLGFSRRKAEYVVGLARLGPRPRGPRGPARRRGEGAADRASRDRRVDGGLVPCAPPRPSGGMAGRRSRPAQGRPPLLRRGGHARPASASRGTRTSPPTTSSRALGFSDDADRRDPHRRGPHAPRSRRPAARGEDHVEPRDLPRGRRRLGPGGLHRAGADLPRAARARRAPPRRSEGALLRRGPRPDRRRRGGRPRGPAVRAAASGRIGREASSRRRATAGRPSTTSSATGSRRCSAGSRASSPTAWARSCSCSASRRGPSSASSSSSAGA